MSARRRRPPSAPAATVTSPGQGQRPGAPEAWLRAAPLCAALVALAVYLPSLGGGFLYDDGNLVLRNAALREPGNLRAVLLYEPSRPLLTLSLALNAALGGLEPWHFHLVNVLIHAANAALLASLLGWLAARGQRADLRASALVGACLFAATPMAAETVAYVASRSSALAALFVLASLRVALPALAGGPRWRLAAGLVLFALAAATKEEAAALPLLLLLLDFFFVAGQDPRDVRRRAWAHAPFFGLLLAGLVARRWLTGAWLPAQFMDPRLYLLTQLAAFPLYLGRAVIPLDPAFYRFHPPATWPPGAATLAGVLATVAVAAGVWLGRRRWPEWSFAVAALAAGLLPSSSVVSLNEMVVDHRAYLGSFGVSFAVGALAWRRGGGRLALLLLALCAARSLHYQWVLADPVRAWHDAVARAPASADAQCALGEALAARGDARAERAFLEATRLGPGVARYWANLGLYYAEAGRAFEAVPALRRAVDLNPRDGVVRDYLGRLLLRLGRAAEGQAELEAAVAAEPGFIEPYLTLAELALRRGDTAAARALLESASRLGHDAEQAARLAALVERAR